MFRRPITPGATWRGAIAGTSTDATPGAVRLVAPDKRRPVMILTRNADRLQTAGLGVGRQAGATSSEYRSALPSMVADSASASPRTMRTARVSPAM